MVAVLFSGSHQIFGQPEFGMEYISELQPTVHYIKNSISDGLVGVLRFGIEI